MIPRILHSGVFGGYKLSGMELGCMESWHNELPDYEVRHWTDVNGPVEIPFFKDARKVSPVNASNFIRFWALYEYGGVYLDNDVEVLREFDLSQQAFLGFQRDDTSQDCINTAVLAAVPRHPFIGACLELLSEKPSDIFPVWGPCTLPTDLLREQGMHGLNVEQMVGDVMVYAKDRFYPYRWDEAPDDARVTDRTFAIHHWNKGWKP